MNGIFCVSLDSEFFWGVHDFTTIEQYGENIIGARENAIPSMLELFQRYGIHATWAFVGGACAETHEELMHFIPDEEFQPSYENKKLSPYHLIDQMNEDSDKPSVYLAGKTMNYVCTFDNQEIGTHTFSHFFCHEAGQTIEQFSKDLDAAMNIANCKGINVSSIVFPKNQIKSEYLLETARHGIKCYRGIEENWIYSSKLPVIVQRMLRFADAYFPVTGHNCHKPILQKEGIWNIKGSRIFKPYMKRLWFLEPLKVMRIKGQMRYAAKHGLVFHLWWHPHNFGMNTCKNLENLEKVLKYFKKMENSYHMKSCNMKEICITYEEQKYE